MAPLLAEFKAHLDALVAEQRKKYDQYEARLARMSPGQKALLYSKRAGEAVYDTFKDEFLAPQANMPKEVNDAYLRQADNGLN